MEGRDLGGRREEGRKEGRKEASERADAEEQAKRTKEEGKEFLQRGVNLFELFAKNQPGVAGCGWLQPGRNFLST